MLYVCYCFKIGTVDTPSLQGRIAAQGDAEKVHVFVYAYVYVCANVHASMYVLVFTYTHCTCVSVSVCAYACVHTYVRMYCRTLLFD